MEYWEGKNRRQSLRVKYPCLVVIYDQEAEGGKGKQSILTHTDNIGVGGVCISLKTSLKRFVVVDVELDLLDLEEHIHCKGKVMWVSPREKDTQGQVVSFDVGIEFVDIKEENSCRLKRVIQRLEENDK